MKTHRAGPLVIFLIAASLVCLGAACADVDDPGVGEVEQHAVIHDPESSNCAPGGQPARNASCDVVTWWWGSGNDASLCLPTAGATYYTYSLSVNRGLNIVKITYHGPGYTTLRDAQNDASANTPPPWMRARSCYRTDYQGLELGDPAAGPDAVISCRQ